MEIRPPRRRDLRAYLAACQESIDHNVHEWMPLQPGLGPRLRWHLTGLMMLRLLASGRHLPPGVPRTITYWCFNNRDFVGEFQLRPSLSPAQAHSIGHIGYAVRWSQWGKGYGTQILHAAVQRLHALGLSPILIEIHPHNAASLRCAEKCSFQKIAESTDNSGLAVWVMQRQ